MPSHHTRIPREYVCYYCGAPADSTDHVVPQSMLDDYASWEYREIRVRITGHGRRLTVEACRQCNLLLGDRFFGTLAERKAYLKERLRHYYQDLLATPDWTPEELATLSGRLREYVEIQVQAKRTVEKRLAW